MQIISFLKKLPLEIYVLLLPSVLIISGVYFSGGAQSTNFREYPDFISRMIVSDAIIIVLVCVIIIKFITLFLKLSKSGGTHIPMPEIKDILRVVMSALMITLSVVVAVYAVSLAINYVFSISLPDDVAVWSQRLMNLDKYVFGTYLPFALQGIGHHSSLLEILIVNSYVNLMPVLMVFLVLVFFKKDIFRKSLFALFISFIISVPFWYFYPAIGPSLMYRNNILNLNTPPEVTTYIEKYKPTNYNAISIEKLDKYWTGSQKSSLAVSNNPSMHIAWGIVILWFSIEFLPILGFFTVPWFILEALGTLYTFQHYAIDVVTGIIVGVVGVLLSGWLIKMEKRYFNDKYGLLSVFGAIRRFARDF